MKISEYTSKVTPNLNTVGVKLISLLLKMPNIVFDVIKNSKKINTMKITTLKKKCLN